MPIEMPNQDPCRICQGIRGNEDRLVLVEQHERCAILMTHEQFEVGQCIVVPTRHAGTLIDLTPEEAADIMSTAQRLMRAFLAAFDPLGVLLFQNNGVYSGQRTPHFHLHVVPRQAGSDWGVGPPQLARIVNAGRVGSPVQGATGPTPDSNIHASREVLLQRAAQLRRFLG